jgi:hypothetical protein
MILYLIIYFLIGVLINFKLVSLTEKHGIEFWNKDDGKDIDKMLFSTLIAWPLMLLVIFYIIIKHYKK